MSAPGGVTANLAYLESVGVWHLVSNNLPAKSCRDAASKRNRLGNTGIPVFDELKSHVGAYAHPDGRRYVAVHCRGHQQRDEEKINAVVGFPVERLNEEELKSAFNLEYGLVNPFLFARQPNTIQIFDLSVVERYFTPHTMMTNAGSDTFGVEFDPRQLVQALPNCSVADMVTDESHGVPTEHSIGILTGNGPESGMELWHRINAKIQSSPRIAFCGDTSFPSVVIQSIPAMGLSMELADREAEVRATVLGGIDRLCAGGATVVGIACNTTQYFSDEISDLCASHCVQFVSLVDETAAALGRMNVQRFDLLGIGAVSDLERWSDFRRIAAQFEIEVPKGEIVKAINDLAFAIKKNPEATGSDVSTLRRLIDGGTQTDTVLLALTELSLVVVQHPKIKSKSRKNIVDTLDFLADRMAATYLEERMAVEPLKPDYRPQGLAEALEPVSSEGPEVLAGVGNGERGERADKRLREG